MVIISEKIGFLSVERVLFNVINTNKSDMTRIMRIDSKLPENWYTANEKSYTVISNLTMNEEELLNLMRKKVKYEVTRAEKDELTYEIYDSEQLANDQTIIEEFEKAYIHFAKELEDKNVIKAYKRDKIDLYIRNHCLLLTCMRKGNLAVYHVYMYDENEAVLMFSVSDFRDEDIDRNLAGRANKLLHYDDMRYFKKEGLKKYDWGNISSKENYNGIDNFKISFGGEICDKYNVLIGNTLAGKVFVAIYKKIMRSGK